MGIACHVMNFDLMRNLDFYFVIIQRASPPVYYYKQKYKDLRLEDIFSLCVGLLTSAVES